MLHYTPQHVSSSMLLIIRRTNFITTASGIVTLCKQPYSTKVESGMVCIYRKSLSLSLSLSLSHSSAQPSFPFLRPTQPPTQCATWFLPFGVKRPGRVAHQSIRSSANAKMSGVIRQLPVCTLTLISRQNRSGSFGVKKNILHPGIRVTDGPSRSLTSGIKMLPQVKNGPGSSVGIATELRAGRSITQPNQQY